MPIGQKPILAAALSDRRERMAEMSGVLWKRVMNCTGCSKNKLMPQEAQVAAEALETWPCEASKD